MATLPQMPRWADGVTVSAADLNRMSETEQFLADAAATLNFPFETMMDAQEIRNVFHRFRYLHYECAAPVDGQFILSGNDLGQIAKTNRIGVLDLGHGYGYNGPNPYGLTLNRPYNVRFTSDVECRLLFEHYSTGDTIALPYPPPSFASGAVLTANNLNRVASDLTHILQNGYYVGISGFTGRTYSLVDRGANRGFGRARRWTFRRRGRYLHFRAVFSPHGTTDYHYGFEMYLNGTRFYTDGAEYNLGSHYDFVVDLENMNNSVNYGVGVGSFNGVPPTPALGEIYYVDMSIEANEPYNPNSVVTTQLLVESGSATRI